MIYDIHGKQLSKAFRYNSEETFNAFDIDKNIVFPDGQTDPYLKNRLLLFEDNFDGQILSSDNWRCEVGDIRGSSAFLRERNVEISNGILKIYAKRENHLGYTWTIGEITGVGRKSWMFGRFDAKIKFPGKTGSFPAFWCLGNSARQTYPNDDNVRIFKTQAEGGNGTGWPICGEIDITEGIPGNTSTPPCNLWDSNGNSLGSTPFIRNIDTKEWHIYSMEWNDTYMAMLIDGTEYKRWVWSNYNSDLINAYISEPMSILIGMAIGSASGEPSASENEFLMECDWVRVYAPIGVNRKIEPTAVTIPNTLRLKKQYVTYFVSKITPNNASDQTITWISDDETIVVADHGFIYGINYGTTTIRARTVNGKEATCVVTVVDSL